MSFKMAAATAHYKKARKQRVLRAWLDFIPIRRRKSRMTGVAMEMHAHNLKVKVWSHWTSRVAEIQQLAELEEEVVARSISARLRRMFIGWKLCILKFLWYLTYEVGMWWCGIIGAERHVGGGGGGGQGLG